MSIFIYGHVYIFTQIICRMFIQKLKVYFGVVDIFVIFLYSTDFRKDKGKEGRQEGRQGCWHWELVRIPMKERDMKQSCCRNTTISDKVLERNMWLLSRLIEKEAVVLGHWDGLSKASPVKLISLPFVEWRCNQSFLHTKIFSQVLNNTTDIDEKKWNHCGNLCDFLLMQKKKETEHKFSHTFPLSETSDTFPSPE